MPPPHLQVKNWRELQVYKDRTPPWIRLYPRLLRDKDFMKLPELSKWHLMGCWLWASETIEGTIPFDEEDARFQLRAKGPVLQPLIDAGWLVVQNDTEEYGPVQDCTERSPETETETETETEGDLLSGTENGSEPDERVLTLFEVIGKTPTKGWTHGEKKWPYYESHMIRLHGVWGERINLIDCVLRAQQWVLDNPVKRKTYDGMGKFLSGWITRDVNAGRGLPPISLEKTINAKRRL